MIEFKERAVCHANDGQFYFDDRHRYKLKCFSECGRYSYDYALKAKDFQLNEPKSGYYIPKSELDTEEKYNQAVEVFRLSGVEWKSFVATRYNGFDDTLYLTVTSKGLAQTTIKHKDIKTKLTFDQLMAIGELKRKMNERELKASEDEVNFSGSGQVISDSMNIFSSVDISENIKNVIEQELGSKPAKKRKAKEAYRILESMGIEWDNVEGKWFKVSKEWL